ncbi:protein stoned-B isoform X1 [Lucilia cuprina]|uniref:protein stoned-B isoform X1 n=1 Tax=Lucilia cuprina TaxID=7375 RepID=UPI001F0637A0|nr:protein stoned-B isoform X1 [Lucilia cuprina]
MANPFLMDDEMDGVDDPTVNPFLIQADASEANEDNPFGASDSAVNPFVFGDDAEDEAEHQEHDIDPAMSFFGTTIEAEDDALSIKSTQDEEEDNKTKAPPPRPLPPKTQELINSVSNQMDETSSELLGRIPATRSPSPVSMRDLHSPSPTPDSGLADLLDVSDSGSSGNTQGFDIDLIGSGSNTMVANDNPFGVPTGIPPIQGATPMPSPAKQQPPRPPPPRPAPPRPVPPSIHGQQPPPRPTPPAPPPPVPQKQEQDNPADSEDLFDMFGTTKPPKPPPPKSKEDILSLFDKPAQPVAKPDLLSDDLVLDPTAAEPEAESTESKTDDTVIFNSVLTRPDESTHNITSEPQSATYNSNNQNRIAVQEPTNKQRAPTPDIEITTVEDLPRSDDEDEPEPQPETKNEVPAVVIDTEPDPPVEDDEADISTAPHASSNIESDQSPPTESAATTQALPDSPIEGMSDNVTSDADIELQQPVVEEMDTGLDFAPPSGSGSANPFASPDEEEETYPPAEIVTNIFNADDTEPVAENIFTSTADTVTENIFTSTADTVVENIFTSTADTMVENIFTSTADTVVENIFTSTADTMVENIFTSTADTAVENIFSSSSDTGAIPTAAINIFAADPDPVVEPQQAYGTNIFAEPDEFDAFSAKFESVKKDNISILDGFGGGAGSGAVTPTTGDAWGESAFGTPNSAADAFADPSDGFGNEDDDFYSMQAPVRSDSVESVEKDFNVVIRPKTEGATAIAPQLAPPPPTRTAPTGQYSEDVSPAVNPFEETGFPAPAQQDDGSMKRTDSQETPQTPLFDEDVSQPLEEFPRLNYVGPGWEMQLRQPNKKKITGQRFWKKIFVRLVMQNDIPVVQLFNQASDKQPFQELPLQPSYSVSEIGAQQYDQFGKIFTMKLQYIFYKERPGVRPGQVTKAERITNKLTKFAQYAIAGDYEGVKEFGSDLKKLGLPVEHAPQSSQLFKIGSMNYEDMKQFSVCIEEALFHLPALRERALTYKMEEVQVTAVDEIYVEQDIEGKILKQIARVRVFFLAFLTGMPYIELGVNDMWRQGKEVVGRHDIIPVATEEWIRLEAVEFHSVVNQEDYEKTRIIKFQPPDANYIELLRFRIRPPKNRELPLQLKAQWIVTGNKVELRADILVPGFTSRKLGQIPCEDVSVRFPIPECWIYLFRVEKHFSYGSVNKKYGSVKSAHRRTGKIKGIERILGAVDTLQESLIEVTSGQAKYEHHHRAIVWRCPRLPKEGQGAYTTHQLVCRMALTSYDQIPSELAPYAYVEFTMPATQVSHTTIRSVSVQDSDSDEPPEKYVRYLARHEYRVGIETTHGESTNAYLAATRPIREEPAAKPAASPVPPPSDSDSDSN